AKLASLAIDRGRELRKAGDLGAAMKVLRSVLEIAPSNEEAAQQVLELEEEIAAKLASSPARVQAPTAPQVVARPPTHRPVQPSPRAPVAATSGNRRTVWLVGAAVVLLAVAVSGVLMMRARRAKAPPPPIVAVTPTPAPAPPPPAPVDVAPPPAVPADAAATPPSPPPLPDAAAP